MLNRSRLWNLRYVASAVMVMTGTSMAQAQEPVQPIQAAIVTSSGKVELKKYFLQLSPQPEQGRLQLGGTFTKAGNNKIVAFLKPLTGDQPTFAIALLPPSSDKSKRPNSF